MPNWVTNIVIPKDMERFKEAVKGETSFDFNKLIPCPESMLITSPSIYRFGHFSTPSAFQTTQLDPVLRNIYNSEITCEKFTDSARNMIDSLGLKDKVLAEYQVEDKETESVAFGERPTNRYNEIFTGYFNLHRYGATNWYNWRCEHWGTKWDLGEDDIHIQEDCIIFDTAWSTPVGIWKYLADKFDFAVMFADEDIGSNCGIILVEDGKISSPAVDDDDLSTAFANCVVSSPDYDYSYEEEEGYRIPSNDAIGQAKNIYNKMLSYWKDKAKSAQPVPEAAATSILDIID